MESVDRSKPLLTELRNKNNENIFESFMKRLSERRDEKNQIPNKKPELYTPEFINEEFSEMINQLDKFIKD